MKTELDFLNNFMPTLYLRLLGVVEAFVVVLVTVVVWVVVSVMSEITV